MNMETIPKDLRIGNYIEDIGEGEIFQVSSISKSHITAGAMTIYPAGFEFDYYIKLTPEWLDRFGFKYNKGFRDTYECEAFELYGSPMESGWSVEGILGEHLPVEKHRKIVIEYVHQLQNLYFALTGKELTLKEQTF